MELDHTSEDSRLRFFDPSLPTRLLYAVVAGLLWFPMGLGEDPFWSVLRFGSGSVFTLFVVVPYLTPDTSFRSMRVMALLVVGALSYYFALWWVNEWPNPAPAWLSRLSDSVNWDFVYGIGVAGVHGAAVVGLGARIIVPLKLLWRGWAYLLVAGFVGGLAVGLGANALEFKSTGLEVGVHIWPGHLLWEVLVCLALYYGHTKQSVRKR